MGKEGLVKIESHLFQGLSLRFVDCHGKCWLDGELNPLDLLGAALQGNGEVDPGHEEPGAGVGSCGLPDVQDSPGDGFYNVP